MALKGLDIFKLSPKKNCKECGSPTCMAFCMKVAQGAVSIDKCPYFSDDAKAVLNEQTAPPMKTITVGNGLKLGGETVLFRHEKTLVNKNLYAVSVCTGMDDAAVDAKLAQMQKVDYERIGERMYVEFVLVANKGNDPEKYAALVTKAAATGRALILECWDAECAKAALAGAVLSAAALIGFTVYGMIYDYFDTVVSLTLALGVAGMAAYALADKVWSELLNLAAVACITFGMGLFFLNSYPVWADRLNNISMYGSRGTLVPVIALLVLMVAAIVAGIVSCFTQKEGKAK